MLNMVVAMTIRQDIRNISWAQVRDRLYGSGFASLGRLLSPASCNAISGWYDDENLFRSHIEMARYRFGKGEYKYFAYPLPDIVAELRESLYRELAPIASEWMRDLGQPNEFSADLQSFLQLCHSRGQRRPTRSYCAIGQAISTACIGPLRGALLPLSDDPCTQSAR
jgi:hypothetical protein